MRAAIFKGPRAIEVGERPDPVLLDDVLEGRIDPGRVFDFETDLDHIAEAYKAMDERRAIKSLIRIGTKEARR